MALNTTRTENNLLLCYLLFDSHTSSNICIISERSTLLCGGTWKVSVFSLVSIFTSSLNVVPDSVTLTLKRLTSLVWVKEKMKSPLPSYRYFLLKDEKYTFRGGQMQAFDFWEGFWVDSPLWGLKCVSNPLNPLVVNLTVKFPQGWGGKNRSNTPHPPSPAHW